MSSLFQVEMASYLDDIKVSFSKLKVQKLNKNILTIHFNIPREHTKSEEKLFRVLGHLYHILNNQLRIEFPAPRQRASYAIECNTLLEHKVTGETRIFRQSFSPTGIKQFNVIKDFAPIPSRKEMAKEIDAVCRNEESLRDTINLPVSKDSDWGLIGILSILLNVQLVVNGKQISQVGMKEKKVRHFVVKGILDLREVL